jgi:gluconolactonase
MYGFEPIKIIESEIFATLPPELQSPGKGPRSATRINKTGTTLEGPSFDRDGNLYFVDISNSRILRMSSDKKFELICEYDGEPNGLKIHKDGRIFVADHRHGLMQLDPVAGTIKVVLNGPEKESFKGVNDLVFASNGDLYFTDQGGSGLHDPTGRIYRLSADGELLAIIKTIPGPNGIVLHENEKIVYVVTRMNSIWQIPMTPRGGVSKVGEFARLPCPSPDGLAADEKGNILVAAPGLGVVWGYSRQGVPIFRVDSCAGHHLTNIAYGGPGNRWLYMTEGDSFSILRAEMPYPRRLMYSHM